MVAKQRTWVLLIIAVALFAGCPGGPATVTPINETLNQTTSTSINTTTTTTTTMLPYVKLTLPVQPGYDKYEDHTVRTHAASITAGCGDDECKLLALHKYAIDNFYYKEYSPAENSTRKLFSDGYGVSSDFASYYYNYLTASGIQSYIATTSKHTYALACGMNLTRLARRIENDSAFVEFTHDVVFPSFDFETDQVFNRTCLRIEGPTTTRGVYSYPGQHYELAIVEGGSFFSDPKTSMKEPLSASAIRVEPVKALILRTMNFIVSENANIDWSINAVGTKVNNSMRYTYTAYALALSIDDNFATFTLPETTRFDRLRFNITIESTQPLVFYTLQDADQLPGLKYALRIRDNPREKRVDVQHTGRLPWEFEYIDSCSQTENTTHYQNVCTISDVGRRLFVLHNTALFEDNDVTVTVKYLKYL
jgi:hypothetical protein